MLPGCTGNSVVVFAVWSVAKRGTFIAVAQVSSVCRGVGAFLLLVMRGGGFGTSKIVETAFQTSFRLSSGTLNWFGSKWLPQSLLSKELLRLSSDEVEASAILDPFHTPVESKNKQNIYLFQ